MFEFSHRNANESLQERVDTNLNTSILWKDCQVSPDLNGKRGSRMLDFPNGIMPISKSQRNSLVSEPSFDELLPDVTISHTPDLPVPDVISSRSKIVTSPPKSASTPARGNGRNTKAEKSVRARFFYSVFSKFCIFARTCVIIIVIILSLYRSPDSARQSCYQPVQCDV